MKSKKIGTVLSTILLLISVVEIAACLLMDGYVSSLLLNIGIGVFGSGVVSFIISIGEYYVEKRTSLENYYLSALKLLNCLRKIEYYSITKEVRLLIHYSTVRNNPDDIGEMITQTKENAFNNLLNYYKNDYISKHDLDFDTLNTQQIKAIIDVWTDKAVESVSGVCNTYLKLNNVDLNELENAFGKLDFIFANAPHWYINKNKLCRDDIYNTIHNPMRKMFNSLKAYLIYLTPNSNNKNLSIDIITDKISQLNELLFKEEIVETEEYIAIHVNRHFFNNMDNEIEKLRAKIYNVNPENIEHHLVQSQMLQKKC